MAELSDAVALLEKASGQETLQTDEKEDAGEEDEESKTLNKLAQIINDDNRNINMLIPIRDGLMICIKNSS